MTEILDLVDEHDNVIGVIERETARLEGVTVRVVYVLFYTSEGNVILQRRSLQKKTMPGKLTTTVSGHVERGATYLETAVKETLEEAGVTVAAEDLIDLGPAYYDSTNGMRWAGGFIYKYDGTLESLTVEEGEGDGFELVSISALRQMLRETPGEITPFLVAPAGSAMLDAIEARVQ